MRLKALIILLALTSARIAFGYQFQTVASLATDLMARFALTYTQLGTLIGTYMLCGAVSAVPLGLLGRRFGEGRLLTVGLTLMTGGSCFSAMSSTAIGIGAGRAVAGFGAVAMIVLQNKIIAEWFAGGRFVAAISITVCAFPVGMGLASLILPAVLEAFGWRAALFTDAIPAVVALVLFAASYAEPLTSSYGVRRFSLPSRRECMLLAIAGATWMAYTAGFSGYISYLPTALALRGHSLPLIGAVMAIALWGNVVGTLVGGSAAARLGGFNIFVFGTLSLVAGMIGLMDTGWPISSALVFGVLGSLQAGVVMAASTLSAKPENRAVGMGLFYTIYYAGGALVPSACGMAADYVGKPEGGMIAGTILSLIAIPTFLVHRILTLRQKILVDA